MTHLLPLVLLLAPAAEPKPLTLRWLGQSFFVLETPAGTRVAFDPHAIDAFGRQTAEADLVLVSHPHPDHARLDMIPNRAKAKVIEGVKTAGGEQPGGPPPRAQWNPVDEQFRDVRVKSVGTYHDNEQGMRRGKNAVFVVEAGGLTICHLGDLGHLLSDEQLRQIGPVDVLMIPVGGVYTLNGDKAKKVVEQIKPRKYVIPMHYGTKVFDELPPPDEFLDGQPNVEKKLTTNVLTLSPDFKPAAAPVVLLGWQKP